MTRAIRGAITVSENTSDAIQSATVELIGEMLDKNDIQTEQISHVMFTMTSDLDAAYPAKFARNNFGFKYVPMMCYQELKIQNSLKMCLRIMMIVNSDKQQQEIKHIYLRGASVLRPDLI